jgi:hypothetical protein
MRASTVVGIAALASPAIAASNQTLLKDINVISKYWGMNHSPQLDSAMRTQILI